jgi:hypothetical protein
VQLPGVFNPYRDRCPDHDLAEGPDIRRANLELMLDAVQGHAVDELWVGLELGRKGGRRTGLPLTDEAELASMGTYWGIEGLRRATSGTPMNEVTAAFVWQAVHATDRRVAFWNAFPFQCHRPDSSTNRNHSRSEAIITRPYLTWIIEQTAARRIVALGRPAQIALARAGIQADYVRHPARGGGAQFLSQIRSLA